MQQMESDALQPIFFFFTSWIMYIQRSLCLCLDRIYFGVVLTMDFISLIWDKVKSEGVPGWAQTQLFLNTAIKNTQKS